MNITFLGTGTSTGVPQIGCTCKICSSNDPRDRRLRASALVETDSTRVLIDCGPDFREQMLKVPFGKIDGVLLTHEHYDHVGGLDDLRPFCAFGDVDLYSDDYAATHLEERMPYCFGKKLYPGVPQLRLNRMKPHDSVQIGDIKVTAIHVMHAKLPILGYRLNNLVYITDMLTLPDSEWPLLHNVDTLVVNALRHTPHYSHQTVEMACDFARKVGARRTFFIHMGHEVELHEVENSLLPEGIQLAYDGLMHEVL